MWVEEALKNAWGLFSSMDRDVDGPGLSGVSEGLADLIDPVGGGSVRSCGMGASGSKDSGVVAWGELEVTDDAFHVAGVNAHEACVPADPELVADVFGWDFVIGAVEFDVAVSVNGALAFLVVGKGLVWEWA